MKKVCISFLALAIIILITAGYIAARGEKPTTEYLRIHIRADSNSDADQNVKYKVKDAVVEFLTPYLAACDTREKADETIKTLIPRIERVADGVLGENGFGYSSEALIRNEKFPTRVYGELTLDCGYYDALIINLGSGKGDNWWCVVYPPLCFTGEGQNYVYKSKIYEIIKRFYEKQGGKNEKSD
ncbi:MAG: stage II sporulation protein R [Candidatus Borkfalkiaceae bacterium]|nr:stage II sporulation protein R [Christensenellaceae bacterium]